MLRSILASALLLTACDATGACAPPCGAAFDAGSTAPDADGTHDGDLRVEGTEDLVVGEAPVARQLLAYLDGERVSATWSLLDGRTVATLDPEHGVLTASGRAGGAVRVRASYGGREADASIAVRALRGSREPGVSDADAAAFDAAPVAAVPVPTRIAYPLDGAVMPQNVLPPDIQWEEGDRGELVRVVLRTPHARVEHLLREVDEAFPRAWLVDAEAWRVLARSDLDAPIAIEVERMRGGEVHRSARVHVRLARGALPGSAYYWSIAEGRILRVDDADGRRADVIPHAPRVSGEERRCVGCHAISPSGRWMAASMGSGSGGGGVRVGAVFDLTTDLSGDPAPTTFSTEAGYAGATWAQGAWSPDESRLVVERDLRLALVDPFSGRDVPLTAGAWPADITVQPEWSPDGRLVAYVRASSWTVDFLHGDIAVVDVTGPDALGAERVLHLGASLAAAPEGGEADSYPTFSPDSAQIAFAHGTGSFSATSTGALYAMRTDGGELVRLDRASGEGADAFAPRFAPIESGGYHWLAFHSHRAYGNARRGRAERDRERVHGIWIAAVRADAAPGEDPSEVPYFLPGQDPHTSNVSVAFTLRACRENGEACGVGAECCSGECAPDGAGASSCAPPPPDRCRERGQTCDGTGCCGGLACFAHVCVDDLI